MKGMTPEKTLDGHKRTLNGTILRNSFKSILGAGGIKPADRPTFER